MTARQRGQAFGSGYIALLLSNWIDERFKLPKPALPKLRGIDVETASLAVRSEWGLGQRPIPNLIHLLEAHGVRVFSLVEECRELDAFSFWRGDVPYIFLNTMKSAEHSRMDASHELGHLTLHWKEGARGRDAEKEAEMFGGMFLMPSDDVKAQAPRRASLNDIIKAKHRWNTSAAALTRRLKDIGLLTDWRYRSLFIEMSSKGYRTSEPEASKPETSKLLAKVFKTLREEGVTKPDIARELDILPEELEKLVFGLVLTPVESASDSQDHTADVERPTLRLI